MDDSDVNSDLDFDAVIIGVELHENNRGTDRFDVVSVENDFYGYELLLLLRFQSDPELFLSWIERYDKQKNSLDFDVVVSVNTDIVVLECCWYQTCF